LIDVSDESKSDGPYSGLINHMNMN